MSVDAANAALRQRPIYGGVFGAGQYALASVSYVAHGLHAVRFMVIEPHAGAVLSIADAKAAALAAARRMLLRLASDEVDFAYEAPPTQTLLWPDDPAPVLEQPVDPHQRVSRRRREIFERCDGRCHYCGVELQLAGAWHAEHMVPRALGGGDDPWNLVAACVPCNLSKRDRTALEFVTNQT